MPTQRSAVSNRLMHASMIAELLRLLSCGDLVAKELAEAAEYVRNAPENPELGWIDDPATAMTFALYEMLFRFAAEGDKIDEIHEQLEVMFDPPLPSFPYQNEVLRKNSYIYFRWLDKVLAGRGGTIEGGFELISFDLRLDDHLRVLPVYRRNTPRILKLAESLPLRIAQENGIEPRMGRGLA
jgi:hypothetical protein